MDDDLQSKWCCYASGLVFDPFEDVPEEQWDDMHCPDCGSNDLGGMADGQ